MRHLDNFTQYFSRAERYWTHRVHQVLYCEKEELTGKTRCDPKTQVFKLRYLRS